MGFNELLQIKITHAEPGRVEMTMPITPEVSQPYGFLHGGATLTLIEAAASKGAELMSDLERERPFGIEVDVRHRKSAQEGTLRAVAELDHTERSKQVWNVAAYDDAGDVISEGTFVTKIVSLERLSEKGVEVPALPVLS